MIFPQLYKFLDANGARLTLDNRTFRHAKPSDFNDSQDLTIQSVFPEETEVALGILANGLVDVLIQNIESPPTCASPLREKVAMIQAAFRANPDASEIVRGELAKYGAGGIYNVEHMRAISVAFIKEINEFLQGYRVLCVTTQIDSERMWERYGEHGKGVALRIAPNLGKDSKFRLFRPVSYVDTRPPIYDETLRFLKDSLFGDHMAIKSDILEKIIYAKTREWECENEYRLVVPLRAGEVPWDTLPYHPEEITELYLGANMLDEEKEELVAMARAVNPDIGIFQVQNGAGSAMIFSAVVGS